MNKPVGVLSQTDENNKYSINEWLIGFLINKGEIPDFNSFKPSCSNRIDRNTSGLILAAKTYAGSRYLSDCIKGHSLEKYYLAVVHGHVKEGGILKGYLKRIILIIRLISKTVVRILILFILSIELYQVTINILYWK